MKWYAVAINIVFYFIRKSFTKMLATSRSAITFVHATMRHIATQHMFCLFVCLFFSAELCAKYKVQVGTAVEASGHEVSVSPRRLSNQNQI